jgi:putative sterol carrier protein
MTELSVTAMAEELREKTRKVGNLGVTMRFVINGEGAIFIDAARDVPEVTLDAERPADVTISASRDVWLDLRAKKIAPHIAAMTGKLKLKGDVLKGMQLAPRLTAVL